MSDEQVLPKNERDGDHPSISPVNRLSLLPSPKARRSLNNSPRENSSEHSTASVAVVASPPTISPRGAKRQPINPRNEDAAEVPLAQSLQLLQKGLRKSDAASPASSRQLKTTKPQAFHFHKISERALPKSSIEREMEMMESFQSSKFKANPAPSFIHETKDIDSTSSNSGGGMNKKTAKSPKSTARSSNKITVKPTLTPRANVLHEEVHRIFQSEFAAPVKVKPPKSKNNSPKKSKDIPSPSNPKLQSIETNVISAASTTSPRIQASPTATRYEKQDIEISRVHPIAKQEQHQKQLKESLRREDRKVTERTMIQSFPVHTHSNSPRRRHEPVQEHGQSGEQLRDQRQLRVGESAQRMVSKTNRDSSIRASNGGPKAVVVNLDDKLDKPVLAKSAIVGGNACFLWDGSGTMVFLLLALFRVLNVFLIQSYFDADEFWQTMEPAYCKAFVEDDNCVGLTWEWRRRAPENVTNFVERSMLGPARSYLSVLPTYIFYKDLEYLHLDYHWIVARGPMILYALTVAAPTDFAVWYASRWLDEEIGFQRIVLFCEMFSWFNCYSLVRTFANSQETELLALAIALLSPELLGNKNERNYVMRSSIAFFLGGLSVAMRFTSLAAFVPMGLILALRKDSAMSVIRHLLVPSALFGFLGLMIALVVDKFFFGFWTVPFLGNFHFNVILNYAGLYGSHPWHWYFTSGLPAIAGLLLPCIIFGFVDFVRGRTRFGERSLWIIALFYLVIMSFNMHKEFRYIHPVLPLFCLLVSKRLHIALSGKRKRSLTIVLAVMFLAANFLAVIYLGLFHQSGSILANRKIVQIVKQYSKGWIKDYSVYYLTGACHSTPLHSHLHVPPHRFRTYSLDCSPECRADPNRICEYEAFQQDPLGFVNTSMRLLNGDRTCAVGGFDSGSVPDFVVTLSSYTYQLRLQLEELGMKEVARYPQYINGAKVLGCCVLGKSFDDMRYSHRQIVEKQLEVSLEEVIVFSLHG